MLLIRLLLITITLLVSPWASAGVETIDGQVPTAATKMFFYIQMGNGGTFSYVTGTCAPTAAGAPYMSLWVATQYRPYGGGTELQCDAQGHFGGYVSFMDSATHWLLGEQPANLYAATCSGFTACSNAPVQVTAVTVRYLDVKAFSNLGFQGTSSNRFLQMEIDSGQELGSEAGATGFFMAALYGGSIYMIYAGQQITCNSGPQVVLGQAGTQGGFFTPCYELIIAPFSPQTFIPIATGPSGQAASGSVTVYFGPLNGIHGVTVLGGAAKSLDQLLSQKQYAAIARID